MAGGFLFALISNVVTKEPKIESEPHNFQHARGGGTTCSRGCEVTVLCGIVKAYKKIILLNNYT